MKRSKLKRRVSKLINTVHVKDSCTKLYIWRYRCLERAVKEVLIDDTETGQLILSLARSYEDGEK